MLDASFKSTSSSTGYIGFSLLLHSGFVLMLATMPNWRDIPMGTTEWTEVAIITEAPPLGNTPQPVITDLPPQPATVKAVKEEPKTPDPKADTNAVIVAKPKPAPKKKAVKAKAKPAKKKQVAKKAPPPPARLPEKNEPEPTPEPELQEMSPVVVAKADNPPPPSNIESLEESDAYQDFQKEQLADNDPVPAENDPLEEINQEVEELENEEGLIAADPNIESDSDLKDEAESNTEATAIAPVASHALAEPLASRTKASSSLPPKGAQNQAAGGRLGIPAGARLNTDLRQHPGNVPPVYPAVARQNAWEGTVALAYTVSPQGKVTRVKVIRSSGYQILDREAMRAISRFRYLPGQQGKTFHPVTFRLTGPAQQSPSRLRTSGYSNR